MFDPHDFLAFSNCLLNGNPLNQNEALFRSIISRSYYSALLVTRETIDKKHIVRRPKKPSHQEIINKILRLPTNPNINQTQLITLKINLEELRNYRMSADYKFPNAEIEKSYYVDKKQLTKEFNPETKAYAEYVIKSAKRFIQQMDLI